MPCYGTVLFLGVTCWAVIRGIICTDQVSQFTTNFATCSVCLYVQWRKDQWDQKAIEVNNEGVLLHPSSDFHLELPTFLLLFFQELKKGRLEDKGTEAYREVKQKQNDKERKKERKEGWSRKSERKKETKRNQKKIYIGKQIYYEMSWTFSLGTSSVSCHWLCPIFVSPWLHLQGWGAGQINFQVVWTLYDTSPPLAVSFSSVLGMVINVDP